MERIDENNIARWELMAEVSGEAFMRETEVMLDGWWEGGLRQEINDGGGCSL